MTNLKFKFANKYSTQTQNEPVQEKIKPIDWSKHKITNFVKSKEEFEHVNKIIGEQTVPDPPQHESYPTPSGWYAVNPEKCSKLPYYALRSRYHNYPIYPILRDGSRKLVKIRCIQGDIWVHYF